MTQALRTGLSPMELPNKASGDSKKAPGVPSFSPDFRPSGGRRLPDVIVSSVTSRTKFETTLLIFGAMV